MFWVEFANFHVYDSIYFHKTYSAASCKRQNSRRNLTEICIFTHMFLQQRWNHKFPTNMFRRCDAFENGTDIFHIIKQRKMYISYQTKTIFYIRKSKNIKCRMHTKRYIILTHLCEMYAWSLFVTPRELICNKFCKTITDLTQYHHSYNYENITFSITM